MLGNTTYEDRYCAYVDILGFRELLTRLGQGAHLEVLRGLLQIMHAPEKGSTKSWYTEFRAQSISDAVAISTIVNVSGMYEMLHAIETLTLKLLREGFLIRGALVKGPLYHDEQTVFGEALVRAYTLESTVARFPRVMVTREVVDDIVRYEREWGGGGMKNRVKQSEDGPWYVHSLRTVEALIANARIEMVSGKPDSVSTVDDHDIYRQKIQAGFDASVDDPKRFEKYQWFANYWNASVPYGTTGNQNLVGPGLGSVTLSLA